MCTELKGFIAQSKSNLFWVVKDQRWQKSCLVKFKDLLKLSFCKIKNTNTTKYFIGNLVLFIYILTVNLVNLKQLSRIKLNSVAKYDEFCEAT